MSCWPVVIRRRPICPAPRPSHSIPLIYAIRTSQRRWAPIAAHAADWHRADHGRRRGLAAAAQNPRVELHALSRHGLLPAIQSVALPPERRCHWRFSYAVWRWADRRPRLLRAFRALLRDLQRRGGDWLDAVNARRA
jgi:hypothetical protein